MSKKSYLKGATILAFGGILAKFLGIFFKVPITNILGDYGMSLYSNSYYIYSMLLTISIMGLPVAISKLVSEKVSLKDYQGAHKVFNTALFVLVIFGIFSSLVLLLLNQWIINLAGWPQGTYYAILGIALAPLFVSVMACFRGYFQGLQIMAPTALSQIIESITRVIVGISLCIYLTNTYNSEAAGAGGASFGATAGAMLGGLFLFVIYIFFMKQLSPKIKSQENKNRDSTISIVKKLFIIALPITIAAAVTSLFGLINSFTYASRLSVAGFSEYEYGVLWGQLSGKAQTLVNVPFTFSNALAVSLVPAISESFILKNNKEIRKKTELGIRIILILALPSAVGLSLLAKPIFELIFPSAPLGYNILTYLAYSCIFVMLSTILQSVLQGLNRFFVPVKNLAYGVVVKLVLNYILMAIPSINIYGAVIANIVAYLLVSILNYRAVKKYTNVRLNIGQTIIKPIISVFVMGILIKFVYNNVVGIMGNSITTLLSIAIGGLAYFGVLILIGGITKREIDMIPGAKRFKRIVKK